MDKFSDNIKKIILAGIGAVAVTAEKSKDLLDEMVEKGELTVEQGKVLNEELKHNIKKSVKSASEAKEAQEAKETQDAKEAQGTVSDQDIADMLGRLSPEQLAALKEKLGNTEETGENKDE